MKTRHEYFLIWFFSNGLTRWRNFSPSNLTVKFLGINSRITLNDLPQVLLYAPVNIYLFTVDNRNTRKKCEICSKLTVRHQNNIDVVQVSLLLTLNIFHTFILVFLFAFLNMYLFAGADDR